jgi:excisionase family DNA binding protein
MIEIDPGCLTTSVAPNEAALERLADLIVDRLAARTLAPEWLDSNGAARYLGVSRKALYHLIERRLLPAHQDEPGGKLWFKRSELDDWRLG